MSHVLLNRILFVEDDKDIQTIARLALEDIGGFVVHVCNNGREALACAPIFAPDLILLDVMMPGLDGPATLACLRSTSTLAQIPIVFMTARTQPNELAWYRSLGATDVIMKPFDPMRLPDRVRQIWLSHL